MKNVTRTLRRASNLHALHRAARLCITRAITAKRKRLIATAIGGCAMVVVCWPIIWSYARVAFHRDKVSAIALAVVWVGVVGVSMLIAIAARYRGLDLRDTLGEMSGPHAGAGDPITRIMLLLLLAVATAGAWLMLHALADALRGWRMRRVDDQRIGLIVSELLHARAPTHVMQFAKIGEPVSTYKHYPAYLHWLGLIKVNHADATMTLSTRARRLLAA